MEADKRSIERQETAERHVRTLRTHYVRNRFTGENVRIRDPECSFSFRSEDREIFEILKFRKISGGKVLEPGPTAKVFHSSARRLFRRLY